MDFNYLDSKLMVGDEARKEKQPVDIKIIESASSTHHNKILDAFDIRGKVGK